MTAYFGNRIVLPDSRLLKVGVWLESYPPIPSDLLPVGHIYGHLEPHFVAAYLHATEAHEGRRLVGDDFKKLSIGDEVFYSNSMGGDHVEARGTITDFDESGIVIFIKEILYGYKEGFMINIKYHVVLSELFREM